MEKRDFFSSFLGAKRDSQTGHHESRIRPIRTGEDHAMAKRSQAMQNAASEYPDKWLKEQFEEVCRSLLDRPNNLRGPFVIEDEELKAAVGEHNALSYS